MPTEPLTLKPLEYLSHSRLDAYWQCSLKFKFHYIDKLKPAFTPSALAFGAAFHRAVEEALVGMMGGEMPPVSELVGFFAKDLEEHEKEAPIRYGEKESRESMIELVTRMLQPWTSWPRPAARILAVEYEFSIPIAEWLPPLVGRLDLVEEHETFIAVIDLKSSRGRWGEEDLAQHASQLSLYAAGAQALVKEVGKPIKVGFEIVTKAKAPVVERLYLDGEIEPLDRQVRTATLVLEAVERGIFIPSPSWACLSCPYQGPCKNWGSGDIVRTLEGR